ncbi:hypothetical protein ILYODFUR_032489 [Ilyodon furcidens]|uniref:Uncharacterized protein n=1 Tax=Ilyodon furcidens TaxID=33524 RepID=A0ABV0TCY4_9TELE
MLLSWPVGWGGRVHLVPVLGLLAGCAQLGAVGQPRCMEQGLRGGLALCGCVFIGFSASLVRVRPSEKGIHFIYVRGHVFDTCVLGESSPLEKFVLWFMGSGRFIERRLEFIVGLGVFCPVISCALVSHGLVSGLSNLQFFIKSQKEEKTKN